MKIFFSVFAIILLPTAMLAGWYNIHDQQEYDQLPDHYNGCRPYRGETYRHYDDGWREVVPFEVPDGMVKIAGTRSLDVVGEVVSEIWEVQTKADAQAAEQAIIDARPTRDMEQVLMASLAQLDTLIGSSFATSVPFSPGLNMQVAGAIETYLDSGISNEQAITALRLGMRLQNLMLNITTADSTALYTDYFGQ